MSEIIVYIGQVYGAIDIKRAARKFLYISLTIAAVIHVSIMGIYWGSLYLMKEEPPERVVRIMKYSEIGPPPSIAGSNTAVAPAVSVAMAAARPSVGIPVPVPDAELTTEQAFATQQELSQVQGPVTESGGSGDGSGTVIEQDINIEDSDLPPADFVAFEKGPAVVKQVKAVYPEMARKWSIEGKVIAKLWIDKEGKVRDVVILKSDSEMFNQPAIDAWKQWLFTPAIMNAGPVAVWAASTMNFQLKDQ